MTRPPPAYGVRLRVNQGGRAGWSSSGAASAAVPHAGAGDAGTMRVLGGWANRDWDDPGVRRDSSALR